MQTIAIPKEITKGEELIVIPRKVYERFLRLLKKRTSAHHAHLDKDLEDALEDVKTGRLIGPFSSLNQGLKALRRAK